MNRSAAPTQVPIVAAIFALEGIGTIIRIIVGMFRDEYILDPGVIALPIAVGLMALSNTWRIVAVVILWIAMVACALLAVALAMTSAAITWKMAGFTLGNASRPEAYAVLVATFLVMAWMNWTLNRGPIRAQFRGPLPRDATES